MKHFHETVFFDEVLAEYERARAKFPNNDGEFVTLAALTEEVGELNQAVLQLRYEPHKSKTEADVRKEAAQVCVMVLRLLFDDPIHTSTKDSVE